MTRRLLFLTILCVMGTAFVLNGRSRAAVEVSSGPDNGIVVTLTETDRSALALGDSLQKAHKHDEAITAYREALETKTMEPHVRAECEYNIGLSYTWLGRYEDAEAVFNDVRATYSNDPDAVGYAEYCLAWIEVQKGQYHEAIERLENIIINHPVKDRELKSRIILETGAVYLLFLNNRAEAKKYFHIIISDYMDTKMSDHPYVKAIIEKE